MELPEYCLEYLSESWNQFDKLLRVWLTGMQSRKESKGGESISILSPSSESQRRDSSQGG